MIILYGIFSLEIRPWNRLYPTNSVYQQNQAALVSAPTDNYNNNNNNSNDNKTSNDVRTAIEVNEDYQDYEEAPNKDSVETREIHYETKEEVPDDYETEYYDDYDNATNSQAADEHDTYDESASEEIVNSHERIVQSEEIVRENLESKDKIVNDKKIINLNKSDSLGEDQDEDDGRILIGEAVVSVVTTKSVVNGTYSVPTSLPMTTEQMSPPPTIYSSESSPSADETTEDAMIVASVQTSRSISGARFLPFNLNNYDSVDKNTNDKDEADGQKSSDNKTVAESTESIIDKLDRVQSELSSGFLTGGFRTAGNALQLDVLSEQRPTRKTFTTTSKTPVISKFVPRRKTVETSGSAKSEENLEAKEAKSKTADSGEVMSDQTEKPRAFRIPWPGSARTRITSTTESTRRTTRKPFSKARSEAQDISAFLPPGYKLKKEDQTTEKSILGDILAKSKVNITALLPKDFKVGSKEPESSEITKELPLQNLFAKPVDVSSFLPPNFKPKNDTKSNVLETTATPIQKSLQELFSKSSVDISALLPPGFKPVDKSDSKVDSKDKEIITSTTEASKGGIKLVFPSRPGGRKAIAKVATTSRPADAQTAGPKIQRGWPVRATTEFTGWPTPSTTPISIEKLLEAARTATVTSVNSSMITSTSEPSTTSTSTTTTTTIRPTTPGLCEEDCEVAGTIRIIGNATWVPELLDRNTKEWQLLADEIEKEMNLVFLKSAILRKWYKNIRIDAFSQGSILVDYFVELQDLSQKINTQELKVLFHDSLRAYNAHRWNETKINKGPVRLGNFVIDPKSTDFVVIPRVTLPQQLDKDDRLIPQWAIAVIVIGVGGLLFIIIFGVSVLVNRQNAAKLKPPTAGMYGEDAAKNIIHSSHVASSHRSSHEYPKSEISTIWNEADAWKEKSFESNSNKILMDGIVPENEKYNVYDSWRSDWNGYYYQPSHTSSKFVGYESTANFSRHPPDYDTNF
ncbi:mucin-2 isoform X2 [Microplitis mediator]|uniref:mucin-2 isoform X2 n=1 Tax=Microplitis mediator TaxID=375433 RepID=UPI0025529B36|nr:mucin-2 isoform X2 [Microplitis mediator]